MKRAKGVRQQPLDVQIKDCDVFLSRARSHLAELDTKRAMVSANIHEAEQLLDALKTQLQQSSSPPQPMDADAELQHFRESWK